MSLTWRPRSEIYKDSSGNNTFDPKTFEARSYQWWVYVKKIKGKVVFNNHNYSQTTCRHQWDMRDLLKQLGHQIDATVYVPDGLRNFESAALNSYYEELFTLQMEMKRRGTKTEKNEIRAGRIAQLKNSIREIRLLGAKFSLRDQKNLKGRIASEEKRRMEDLASTPRPNPSKLLKTSVEFDII